MPPSAKQPDGVPRARARGEGSLAWHHGAWRARWYPQPGQPMKTQSLPGKTVAEADAWLDEQIEEREKAARGELSFEALWERFEQEVLVERPGKRKHRSGTWVAQQMAIARNHLIPAFSAIEDESGVRGLIDEDVELYFAGKQGGELPVADTGKHCTRRPKAKLSAQTLKSHYDLLVMLFEWAEHHRRGYVDYSPMRGVERPRDNEPFETDTLSDDFVVAMFEMLAPESAAGALTRYQFAQGTRLSESTGAVVDAWDAESGVLTIDSVLRRIPDGKVVRGPRGKTGAATRRLGHSPLAAHEVGRQIDADPKPGTPIFANTEGGFINASNYRNRVWYPAFWAAWAKTAPPLEAQRWRDQLEGPTLLAAHTLRATRRLTISGLLGLRARDLADGEVRFVDAAGRPRRERLPEPLWEELSLFVSELKPHQHVFPGRRGHQIKREVFIKQAFVEATSAAGLKIDRRIHRARHTNITNQERVYAGLTERERQRRAGHADARTTARYTHTTPEQERQPADVMALWHERSGRMRS